MSTQAPPITTERETLSGFLNKVLAGTAVAIVVALIPNAILAVIFRSFPNNSAAQDYLHIIQVFQFLTPVMAGFLIGQQFKFAPMQMLAVGGAAFIGSGAWAFQEVMIAEQASNIFRLVRIGDLINMMITASLAVIVVKTVGQKFGSLNIILLPIVVGTLVGYVGYLILPYVSLVTTWIGDIINTFTTLQPLLMSLLIAASFAILIVSPISTVAIGLAIGLNGVAAGASAMGIAATAAFLVVGTWKTNKIGVPLAIGLGAMKMMMPNYLKNPILTLPIVINAIICAIPVALFSISGTPASAGFGLVGMVGPVASYEAGNLNIIPLLLSWFIIPIISAFITNYVCLNILKLYKKEVFVFKG